LEREIDYRCRIIHRSGIIDVRPMYRAGDGGRTRARITRATCRRFGGVVASSIFREITGRNLCRERPWGSLKAGREWPACKSSIVSWSWSDPN